MRVYSKRDASLDGKESRGMRWKGGLWNQVPRFDDRAHSEVARRDNSDPILRYTRGRDEREREREREWFTIGGFDGGQRTDLLPPLFIEGPISFTGSGARPSFQYPERAAPFCRRPPSRKHCIEWHGSSAFDRSSPIPERKSCFSPGQITKYSSLTLSLSGRNRLFPRKEPIFFSQKRFRTETLSLSLSLSLSLFLTRARNCRIVNASDTEGMYDRLLTLCSL